MDKSSILITGGTGSLGQKLTERFLSVPSVRRVVVFSRDELKQHEMKQRLNDPDNKLRFFLGDVRDLSRLERGFDGIDAVIHAAALKQVPALEFNPLEAVKTNVLGTQNVIDAVLNRNVPKAIFISSDKAVNPVNLYGATKLCAEKLWIAANAYRGTREEGVLSVVRYGNVIGSRGSVVDVLKVQKTTGVATLTHPDMTRFWITLNQAFDLVFDTLRIMKGGEIFIPKLPAMKVEDLIRTVAAHCEIKVTGVRPGEKIHEVLLTEDEVRRTRDIGKYYLVEPVQEWWDGSHVKHHQFVSADFRYASNCVPELSKEELSTLI